MQLAPVLLVGALVVPLAAPLAAQDAPRRCGTRPTAARAAASLPPTGAARLHTGAQDCSDAITRPLERYRPGPRFRIPVVVHVISATNGSGSLPDARIHSQVRVLNEDFGALPGSPGALGADSGLEFYLARVDPAGNPTSGITRSVNNTWFADAGAYYDSLAWDPSRYLNIYTNNIGSFGILGYVPALPASGGLVGANEDRVVVHYDVFGVNPLASPFGAGRTATHEIGHYLGLFHPHDFGCGTAACYTSGDRICDTPPQAVFASGCPASGTSCGTPDPVRNYMGYVDDLCMWEFTPEQVRRMRCTLEHWRSQLLTGSALARPRSEGNPSSFTAQAPVLGGVMALTVDPSVTGHGSAAVFAYAAPASAPWLGYQLLVDVTAPPGELLGLPPGTGAPLQWTFAIPNVPVLVGVTMFAQAAHFGLAPGVALSNAQDLTIGY